MSHDDLHDEDLRDDPFDRVLRQELHHSVPSPMGAPDQLEQLRPRFVRAQRRRTAITGVVAAAAIALVLVGVGSLTRERSTVVTPAGVTTTPSLPPAPSTALPPVASSAVPAVPPTTAPPAGASAATRVPWAAPNNVATPPAGPTATVAPSPSTMVPSAPRTVPLAAPGGTVVVRVDGATVTLVSSAPAAGWSTTETRTDAGRVEVRFARNGSSDQSRIEARVDNGQLRTVTE